MNNGVFIPIEIMDREYLSKLLLAVELVKRGFPVFLGHKSDVIKLALKAQEPGVLFYKSTMHGGLEEVAEKLRCKGFGIVAQDEEAGIVFRFFEDFYNRRTSLAGVGELDLFFTWGSDEYSFLGEKFGGEIVKNTGSPRASFWGAFGKKFYKTEVESLKSKYGKYVLIASNLATYNSFSILSEKDRLEYYEILTPEYKKLYRAEEKVFNQYVKVVKHIAQHCGKNVILRPHPAESVVSWCNSFIGISNVFVERKDELIKWILGAECIIQNNCTSALEAAAANIPVITYYDDEEDLSSLSLGKYSVPNSVSLKVNGLKSLELTISEVEEVWRSSDVDSSRSKYLASKINNNGTNAAPRLMAEYIEGFVGKPNRTGNASLGRDSFIYDLKEMYRSSRLRARSTESVRDINKRPTLSKLKIKTDLSQLLRALEYRENVNVRRVAQNAFYICSMEDNNG